MQRVMAFDFGTQLIGIAVANTDFAHPTPLGTIKARDGIPDWQALEAHLQEWTPDLFLVGIPVHMDGRESEMSHRARKFGKRLFGRYGKPFIEVDERRTTQEAKVMAKAQGHKARRYDKDPVDALAAALILEKWLQQTN